MNCPQMTKYTIKRGDTLFRLAYIFRTTEEKILALNPGLDPMYLQVGRRIEICPNTASMAQAVSPANQNGHTEKRRALRDKFREHWEQHIMYTRMVINAVVDPEPDDDAVTARLLRNPKDFAQVYRELYGEKPAREIDRLITEHLTVGKQLIAATAQGDTTEVNELKASWYKNAEEWASFLHRLSPNMNESAMGAMLRSHLNSVDRQVASRMAKNYTENVAEYDEGERMALEMADMMSEAILRQFPERFR